MATTTLYLVRHGEAAHPAVREDPDSGLSEFGVEQARRLGQRLADVPLDSIRHSPLRRAEQTAQVVATHLPRLPVTASELLRDRTPVPTGVDAAAVPMLYRPFLERVPAAERDVDAVRLGAAFTELATAGDRDRHELLVTHAFVLGWFVRQVLDAPAWRWMGLNPSCCGLTIIRVGADLPPMLVRYDDVGHLPAVRTR